jgi:hypothetical protein
MQIENQEEKLIIIDEDFFIKNIITALKQYVLASI